MMETEIPVVIRLFLKAKDRLVMWGDALSNEQDRQIIANEILELDKVPKATTPVGVPYTTIDQWISLFRHMERTKRGRRLWQNQ